MYDVLDVRPGYDFDLPDYYTECPGNCESRCRVCLRGDCGCDACEHQRNGCDDPECCCDDDICHRLRR